MLGGTSRVSGVSSGSSSTKGTWWGPERVSGPPPSARCAHSAAIVGSRMYIFGGWNGSPMNDL